MVFDAFRMYESPSLHAIPKCLKTYAPLVAEELTPDLLPGVVRIPQYPGLSAIR